MTFAQSGPSLIELRGNWSSASILGTMAVLGLTSFLLAVTPVVRERISSRSRATSSESSGRPKGARSEEASN